MDDDLDLLRPFVTAADWSGLEQAAFARCAAIDVETANRIALVDLGEYEQSLRSALNSVRMSLNSKVRAVYWEFDLDNDWQSAFFLCSAYQPEAEHDDDWASDFDLGDVIRGPRGLALATVAPAPAGTDPSTAAAIVYLVGRTVAAFGRAAADWRATVPLTAGFHDQTIVFRIHSSVG